MNCSKILDCALCPDIRVCSAEFQDDIQRRLNDNTIFAGETTFDHEDLPALGNLLAARAGPVAKTTVMEA